jgi:hypothetical protein
VPTHERAGCSDNERVGDIEGEAKPVKRGMLGEFAATQQAEVQKCLLIVIEGEESAEKYSKSGNDRDSSGEQSPAALRAKTGEDGECEQERGTGIKNTWEPPGEGDEDA